MGEHDYKARDWQLFTRRAAAFVLPSAGPGYLGTYEHAHVIKPAPMPTGVRQAPTYWGRWGYKHDNDPLYVLDPAGPVVRTGLLVLAVRVEPDCDEACIKGPGGYFAAWADWWAALNGDGVTMHTGTPDENQGLQAGWVVHVLPFKFTLTD